MGFCPDSTPEMGEYSVELRRESFIISSKSDRHAISCTGCCHTAVEVLYEDIPKIRAILDQVEKHTRIR
jgi:hypothetical protein